MLSIVTGPNGVLSKTAKPVLKIDKNILSLVAQMKESLLLARDPEGVGLAAPQIGKSLQIFIVKPTPSSPITVYINPKIFLPDKKLIRKKRLSKEKTAKKLEGCLSLPNIWGEVMRFPKIKMQYLDEKGERHLKNFSGFLSIIMQHEYDHLQGILFPKRVLEQNGQLYKSHKNEKSEDVFDEIDI